VRLAVHETTTSITHCSLHESRIVRLIIASSSSWQFGVVEFPPGDTRDPISCRVKLTKEFNYAPSSVDEAQKRRQRLELLTLLREWVGRDHPSCWTPFDQVPSSLISATCHALGISVLCPFPKNAKIYPHHLARNCHHPDLRTRRWTGMILHFLHTSWLRIT
jgi:hypothetical protein